MEAKYVAGQKVRIVDLIDNYGRPDPQVQRHVDRIATVIRSYCCCDIRLDEDGILPGIPEIALEPHVPRRE